MKLQFFRKIIKMYIGEKISSSINGDGKPVFQYTEDEKRFLFLTLHKTQLQMNQGPPQENVGRTLGLTAQVKAF